MQYRAEMPKSVGRGVSLGLLGKKQVPASGLILPAAVWVTGQWIILVKLAIAESFVGGGEGDFLSVNVFVCDAGIGCYSSYYRTVWKVWSADCHRSARLFVYSFCKLVLNIATWYRTGLWCNCYVMVLHTMWRLLGRSWCLLSSFSFLNHSSIVITVRKIVVLVKHLDIDLSVCGRNTAVFVIIRP